MCTQTRWSSTNQSTGYLELHNLMLPSGYKDWMETMGNEQRGRQRMKTRMRGTKSDFPGCSDCCGKWRGKYRWARSWAFGTSQYCFIHIETKPTTVHRWGCDYGNVMSRKLPIWYYKQTPIVIPATVGLTVGCESRLGNHHDRIYLRKVLNRPESVKCAV